ncbi:MAG: RNA polymerase sigma factor [Acidimicrobiales bacterium]
MGKPHHIGDPEEELARILSIARATALAIGASEHEADEVAQTTAVKLWMKWEADHVQRAMSWDRRRWESYVRRAAKNVHFDLVRGHQRRISRQCRAADQSPFGPHDYEVTYAVPASPSEIEAHLARAMIAEEIMKLPSRQRQVAARMCLEEMSVAEVAADLNIQAQSVRKHLKLARAALRKRLSDLETLGST